MLTSLIRSRLPQGLFRHPTASARRWAGSQPHKKDGVRFAIVSEEFADSCLMPEMPEYDAFVSVQYPFLPAARRPIVEDAVKVKAGGLVPAGTEYGEVWARVYQVVGEEFRGLQQPLVVAEGTSPNPVGSLPGLGQYKEALLSCTSRSSFCPESQGQTTSSVLMVSPTAFESNAETSVDNHFMKEADGSNVCEAALKEFRSLYDNMTSKGISIQLFTYHEEDRTPDACFPNNWFSTHSAAEAMASTLVLYPMKAPSRRRERRADRVALLKGAYHNVVDLTAFEDEGKYLEGTGCLILDRVNRKAYVGISERAHPEVLEVWGQRMGYDIIDFRATDADGKTIYHTNVMMALGTSLAVVCAESVTLPEERARLLDRLNESHEVLLISHEQVSQFCGNVLEVAGKDGRRYLCMSERARRAFTEEQHEVIARHVDGIISADVTTIEDIGGGGVRCTIGELF